MITLRPLYSYRSCLQTPGVIGLEALIHLMTAGKSDNWNRGFFTNYLLVNIILLPNQFVTFMLLFAHRSSAMGRLPRSPDLSLTSAQGFVITFLSSLHEKDEFAPLSRCSILAI